MKDPSKSFHLNGVYDAKTFLKSPGHYSAKARVRNRYLQSQPTLCPSLLLTYCLAYATKLPSELGAFWCRGRFGGRGVSVEEVCWWRGCFGAG